MVCRRVTGAIVGSLLLVACGHRHGPSFESDPFLADMIPHHRLGIVLLEHAVPRVDDVRVRRLVFEMSNYHLDDLNHMQTTTSHDEVDESTAFPGWIAPERIAELDDHHGPAYDLGWLVLMIEHHEGAVKLADAELARSAHGSDDDRQRLARRIATQQRTEIDQMYTLARFLCAEDPDLDQCDRVKAPP